MTKLHVHELTNMISQKVLFMNYLILWIKHSSDINLDSSLGSKNLLPPKKILKNKIIDFFINGTK